MNSPISHIIVLLISLLKHHEESHFKHINQIKLIESSIIKLEEQLYDQKQDIDDIRECMWANNYEDINT